MIDINKSYKTRDGREVRLFTTEARSIEYSVIGEVFNNPVWMCYTWTADGVHVKGQTGPTDLVEVKPVRVFERWLNIYADDSYVATYSQELAAEHRDEHVIATIHIRQEYWEGDGLCDDSEKT